MSRLQRLMVIMFVSIPFLGLTSKSAKETPSIAWSRSWEVALKKATEENRPILVAINAEGVMLENDASGANEDMALKAYRDPKLVPISQQTVNLIASAAKHSFTAVKQADGSFRKECTRFPGVTCEEHQEVEKILRRDYFKGVDEVVAPQHFLLQPNGSVITRREYQVAATELGKMIQDAVKVVGKPKKAPANPEASTKSAQTPKKN